MSNDMEGTDETGGGGCQWTGGRDILAQAECHDHISFPPSVPPCIVIHVVVLVLTLRLIACPIRRRPGGGCLRVAH